MTISSRAFCFPLTRVTCKVFFPHFTRWLGSWNQRAEKLGSICFRKSTRPCSGIVLCVRPFACRTWDQSTGVLLARVRPTTDSGISPSFRCISSSSSSVSPKPLNTRVQGRTIGLSQVLIEVEIILTARIGRRSIQNKFIGFHLTR